MNSLDGLVLSQMENIQNYHPKMGNGTMLASLNNLVKVGMAKERGPTPVRNIFAICFC